MTDQDSAFIEKRLHKAVNDILTLMVSARASNLRVGLAFTCKGTKEVCPINNFQLADGANVKVIVNKES